MINNETKNGVINFLKQPKVINTIIIILFLLILYGSVSIRLQNLSLLIDSTSGEYIPLALDPYYFLRIAETIKQHGSMPLIDTVRYPSLNLPFTNELTPYATIFLYNIVNLFDKEVSLQLINVLSPVIFFTLGLIIFFFLVYVLTNSKGIALLSMAFLAFISPYLYRTMAGFSDHESMGMFAFFLVMLIYALSIKYLEKENLKYIKTILLSIGVAVLTMFTLLSWGGAASFVFMIIPLSFFLIWIIKFQTEKDSSIFHYLLFYTLWITNLIIIGFMMGNPQRIIGSFISPSGMMGLFTFCFILLDTIYYLKLKNKYPSLKNRFIFNIVWTIILSLIVLLITGRSVLSIISIMFGMIIKPFGTERIALTVVENAQPYLMDFISQVGSTIFWISFAGIILIGVKFAKSINNNQYKRNFIITWIIFISCIMFSRIAPNSIFDGENIFSILLILFGIILFIYNFIKIYINEDLKLNSSIILLISFMFIYVLSLRSASRVFFFIVPFVSMSAGFFVFKIKDFINNKEELIRWFIIILFILSIVGSASVIYKSYNQIDNQSKYIGPSANHQWQEAMSWIRTNTNHGEIFIHWWDYGYWIQYLGQRPTITDGGHGNAYWDHLIGRYLLTNKNPDSALSFMKSQNVSYLLIDQTDLGKYPAYSKIGGDKDYDTFSIISTGLLDEKQITESKDKMTMIYNINGIVDEDIIYDINNTNIFIPGPSYNKIGEPEFNAYMVGIIIEKTEDEFHQPIGVFMYNQNQIRIPLRYIYFQDKIIDFGNGLESVAYIFPSAKQTSDGRLNLNPSGAMIYLSPKVSKSLFAQLYLLNNAFNNYPTIKLVHSELDDVVKSLNMQGVNLGDMIYFNGFRGPIRIWKVNYPEDTKTYKEFTATSGGYAELDNLVK